MLKKIALLLSLTLLTGCAELIVPQSVVQRIHLGMTPNEVLQTVGQPEHVNTSVGAWGVHSQWVYERTAPLAAAMDIPPDRTYLYFENGKLTSWQM